MHIAVISGPNTNLYGLDPSGPYGTLTIADIEADCRRRAQALGASLDFAQSNHEGELVDLIQSCRRGGAREADGLVINAGSLSYTSIAIPDALAASGRPAIQVHVSNVFTREAFRHHSPISAVAVGCIIGLGPTGYGMAVEALIRRLTA
ncbi:3-dehydroquinate dehydratase [Ancylobacter sp. 6x-1]|uniref:3-dehydroquinate dehydratase n=1 Tax=Ancylobacter crimeensis TaxID=2579147 RepID=A0ABT0DBE5_9HYPH|nr:type II 3-dehydroquinate dehydratase [Ancylobacter crimeensis]MCK0197281.1 3-dehydroquinate dehydratase [Ancylobacter crimeensis]